MLKNQHLKELITWQL